MMLDELKNSEYVASVFDDAYLQHYGVQGMKWGVRKASSSSTSAKEKRREYRNKVKERRRQYKIKKANHLNSTNYTEKDRSRDAFLYGSRGAKRISKNVSSGKTIKQARKSELKRQLVAGMALNVAVTAIAAPAEVARGATMVGRMIKNSKKVQGAVRNAGYAAGKVYGTTRKTAKHVKNVRRMRNMQNFNKKQGVTYVNKAARGLLTSGS